MDKSDLIVWGDGNQFRRFPNHAHLKTNTSRDAVKNRGDAKKEGKVRHLGMTANAPPIV